MGISALEDLSRAAIVVAADGLTPLLHLLLRRVAFSGAERVPETVARGEALRRVTLSAAVADGQRPFQDELGMVVNLLKAEGSDFAVARRDKFNHNSHLQWLEAASESGRSGGVGSDYGASVTSHPASA
jgi:hypothetical protein